MNFQIYCLSTSTYSENIEELPGVDNSISELMPVLEKNGAVHSCHNKTSTDATNDFLAFVKGLNKTEDEVVLFYFCGHGFLTGENLDCLLLGTTDILLKLVLTASWLLILSKIMELKNT